MEWRKIPPLGALRAFAAFADKGSVVEAGAALNVSHAAISQQLRALEQHLGMSLLDRSGRSLTLTADGQDLADAALLGLGAIERVVQQLTKEEEHRPLHISLTPSFASAWLMPRLSGFRTAHPEIDVILSPTPELVTIEPGGVDVAIRFGLGKWPGLDVERLFKSKLVIIASPELVGSEVYDDPTELAAFPWLNELGSSEAANWLRSTGVVDARTAGLVELPGNLILDGVRNGQGIGVSVREFIEPDLEAGRLRVLFEEDIDTGYFIVTRPGAKRPQLRAFLKWLRKQTSESA